MKNQTICSMEALQKNLVALKIAEVRYVRCKSLQEKHLVASEIIVILTDITKIHSEEETEEKVLECCSRALTTWHAIIQRLNSRL